MSTKYTVISRILDKTVLQGFMIIDELGQGLPKAVSLPQIRNAGDKVQYTNARYSKEYGTLTGVGIDLVSLPSITPDYSITENNGVVAISTIVDVDTKQELGVICFNGIGLKYQVSYKKLNELCSKYKPLNFKILPNNNIVFLDNSPLPKVEMKMPKKEERVYNSNLNSTKPVNMAKSKTEQHEIGIIDLDAVNISDFVKPAQEKFYLALINMQKLTPYYHCCLQAIKRIAVTGLGTMGVTEDTLYYDLEFVASLSVAELTFVLIHEVGHIAQQHSIRGRGKDHDLFNIACDLYINALICMDFGIYYGQEEKTFDNKSVLKTPIFGSYLETIGEVIDLAVDTPETIYKRLREENPNGAQSSPQGQQGQGQEQQGQGQGQEQQGQGQGQSQQGQEQGQSQSQSQGQQGQSKQGQGQEQQGQSGTSVAQALNNISVGTYEARSDVNNEVTQNAQSQINQGVSNIKSGLSSGNQQQVSDGLSNVQQGLDALKSQTQAGIDKIESGLEVIKDAVDNPQQQPNQPNNQTDSEGDLSQNNADIDSQPLTKEVTVTYKGKKLTAIVNMDIMTNNSKQDKDTQDNNVSKSKDALQRIRTKLDMVAEETGEPLVKNAGKGAGLTDRYIDFGLSSSIDWRVLLKNALKVEHKKMFTLASPNTDYMNMGMTLADRRKVGKPSKASGVKIAIDVSGSVSKRELDSYLSEVAAMFKFYEVEGELIYWSTEIGSVGDIETMKDLLKIKPSSTGGTDVRCVFEYLNREISVNGVYQKTKPKDISIIFIITDGVFSHNYSKYERYGKKVVWLISGNSISFSPPFGKIIDFNIKEER